MLICHGTDQKTIINKKPSPDCSGNPFLFFYCEERVNQKKEKIEKERWKKLQKIKKKVIFTNGNF